MEQGQFNILIFEKDENVSSLLQEFLQMKNISSTRFSNYKEAYDSFRKEDYNICLISLNDTPEDGFTLAEKVKTINDEIVLMFMSAHPAIDDLARAYRAGADDFIKEPFILDEIYMRILAILKRVHGIKLHENHLYQLGKYTFDTQKQELTIDNKSTKMTTKEADLLTFMCRKMNMVSERKDILKNVWKSDSFSDARSMDVYITKLRQLLREDNTIAIINVHGKGYKLLIDQ